MTSRALFHLSRTMCTRLLREGFVVRALVWPGLLCAATIFSVAASYAIFGLTPYIVVSSEGLVAPFEAANFDVAVDPDPEARLIDGSTFRGVWRDKNGRYVLGHVFAGESTFRAEAVLRDLAQSPWRLVVPRTIGRESDVDPQTGLMAGVIGFLFTLYGVVMGAGLIFRDRGGGVLEGEQSLPIPNWVHAAARVVALSIVLTGALSASLLLLNALLPIGRLEDWVFQGALAASIGGGIGLSTQSAAAGDRGFSGPLSRALTMAMALLAIGWGLPELGRWIPVSALSALIRGTEPALTVPATTVLILAAIVYRFTRQECL